ncbi:biotin synthase BioB [Methanorbis furvi]|uniref:Biotin synthase n=1 Tax=Methanorbis furvi TaxID=3028299 RepID=A0AAE4MC75_9EURY|nr:Biotin synthase [Methanocorpusculaceae archaeon Ag1]
MSVIDQMQEKVLSGGELTREDALSLSKENHAPLAVAANEIREHFCGKSFDLCMILNAKSGGCSEDCIYCAQSVHYSQGTSSSGIKDITPHLFRIAENYSLGANRCGFVTAGKTLSGDELETLLTNYRSVQKICKISLCASHGLLAGSDLRRLREAGVTRYHANLETSRNYFPKICTTHSYDDKIAVIKAAQEAGLEVCSGGIFGIGETVTDRIDMALELRGLGIKSVPINILHPIPGTPLENAKPLGLFDARKIVSLYRFLLPDAKIRIAGGRGLLPNADSELFTAGANAAISGDMLTTAGVCLLEDVKMIAELGFTADCVRI